MTVPMAAGQSTTMQICKSQKPSSVAVGNEENARTATKLEKAKGQMRRGLSRPATAAPTKVMNATKALKGRITMPEKSTL